MDPFTIAAGLVSMLAPMLSTLGRAAADRAAERAGQSIGDAVTRGALSMWHRIAPLLDRQPDAATAIRRLARHPDDDQAIRVLGGRLAMLLDADPGLLREAADLLDTRDRKGHTHVDITGDNNVVQPGDDNISVTGSSQITIRRA